MNINATFNNCSAELKKTLRKPNMLPAKKAPTGRGETAGDRLVQRLATEFRHDPIAELIKLAKSSKTTPELKAKINQELLQYYLPKLKAIDTNPNSGEVISINVIPANATTH